MYKMVSILLNMDGSKPTDVSSDLGISSVGKSVDASNTAVGTNAMSSLDQFNKFAQNSSPAVGPSTPAPTILTDTGINPPEASISGVPGASISPDLGANAGSQVTEGSDLPVEATSKPEKTAKEEIMDKFQKILEEYSVEKVKESVAV
jgi:hypothetical protein